MSVKGYFGPRRNRPATPAPEPTHSQDELRDLRRRGIIHVYRGGWSLAAELAAICDPLAQRVAAEPCPPGYWSYVDRLADKAHALVAAVVGMVAQSDAEDRTRNVAPGDRGRSIRLLVDLAERPAAPDITDEHLAAGTWPALLIALAEPFCDPLSKLLTTAYPPGHIALRGLLSVSERLHRELREVDRAAAELSRRLDVVARHRETYPNGPPVPTNTAQAKAGAARAELAALGIEA